MNNIYLPMIKRIVPSLIAADMIGVRPMRQEIQMKLGQIYLNEAALYASATDEVEWYWVRLKDCYSDIFTINRDITEQHTIYRWCSQTYGPVQSNLPESPDSRWKVDAGSYYFRNESDRTMFILRWA